MKCPLCQTPLTRIEYESFNLHRCSDCHGHLVSQQRVDAIERRRDKSVEELKEDVEAHLQIDCEGKLRCPRCRAAMRKQMERGGLFKLDTCDACKLVWFDGGELAMLQLRYQDSDQGREQVELQRRLAAMTPEQKAEFEKNLAQMQPGFLSMDEVLLEMFRSNRVGRFPW
jgi:Zn-finger nucleic acid-binding protein